MKLFLSLWLSLVSILSFGGLTTCRQSVVRQERNLGPPSASLTLFFFIVVGKAVTQKRDDAAFALVWCFCYNHLAKLNEESAGLERHKGFTGEEDFLTWHRCVTNSTIRNWEKCQTKWLLHRRPWSPSLSTISYKREITECYAHLNPFRPMKLTK